MTTQTAAEGRFARITSGADAIEIKATIPQRQIKGALKRYKLTQHNDDERLVYFFDTPDLKLLAAGVIVRARRVIGGRDNGTIKFRPVQAEKVGKGWHRFPDFKIEVDASEKGFVKSASFSMPVRKGLIKRVVTRDEDTASLFTKPQEKFLREMGGARIDFTTLRVMGPLKAQRWDFEDPACPWPITAELWRREDGARLMEVSVKARAAQAAAVMAGFMAFLAESGAERDSGQLAKTRWALDYYAAQYRKPSAAPRKKKATRPARARRRSR